MIDDILMWSFLTAFVAVVFFSGFWIGTKVGYRMGYEARGIDLLDTIPAGQ